MLEQSVGIIFKVVPKIIYPLHAKPVNNNQFKMHTTRTAFFSTIIHPSQVSTTRPLIDISFNMTGEKLYSTYDLKISAAVGGGKRKRVVFNPMSRLSPET